jgi:phosphatidylglycerol:prolipoprotein diacylglycerol transferase
MYPVISTVNNFNVYSFGLFLAISFVLSTFIIYRYSKDEFKEEPYLDLYLYTSLVSIIFARIFYIIQNFDQFKFNFLRYFLVREAPGLSLLGGFLSGFLFLFILVRLKKWKFLYIADIFTVAFSLMLSLAKAGEQLGGASFGRETTSFIGVRIIGLLGKRWPVEAIEMIIYFMIFILLTILLNYKNKFKLHDGLLFYAFLFLSSILIFFTEFLKIYNAALFHLSYRQIFSLIIMFVTVYPLYAKIKVISVTKKGKNNAR